MKARKFNENEIFIYATAPISKVVSIAKIGKVYIDTPKNIWKFKKDFSGVDKRFYYDYYENKNKAVAYEIEGYIEFELSCVLRSFVYIK